MRVFTVGETIDQNSAGALTEIDMSAQDIPFNANNSVLAVISLEGDAGTSFDIEGREDSTGAFSVLTSILAAEGQGVFIRPITLTQEIRVNVVGAGTAGDEANVYLIGN